MTLITLSSSVCAEAPGYIVVTTMDGGATDGYCEIGSCVVATPPITSMNSASTHAKTGRSMKNWAMKGAPYLPAAAGAVLGAAAPPPPLPETAATGCHGTAFTGAPGCSFWKPSTITCSPAFSPSSTIHCPFCAEPTLTGRGDTLPSAPTTITLSPLPERVTACCGN